VDQTQVVQVLVPGESARRAARRGQQRQTRGLVRVVRPVDEQRVGRVEIAVGKASFANGSYA